MKNKLEAAIDVEMAAFKALTLATIARRRAEIEGPAATETPGAGKASEQVSEAAAAEKVARQTLETVSWIEYADSIRRAGDRQRQLGLRGTGRTTACVLRAIATALETPDTWVSFDDHFATREEHAAHIDRIAQLIGLLIEVRAEPNKVMLRSPIARTRSEKPASSAPAFCSVILDENPLPRARMLARTPAAGPIDVELSSATGFRITIHSVSVDQQGKQFFPPLELECSDLLRAMKRCVEWSQEPASKPLSPEEMLAALNDLTPRQTSADSSPSKRQP